MSQKKEYHNGDTQRIRLQRLDRRDWTVMTLTKSIEQYHKQTTHCQVQDRSTK